MKLEGSSHSTSIVSKNAMMMVPGECPPPLFEHQNGRTVFGRANYRHGAGL